MQSRAGTADDFSYATCTPDEAKLYREVRQLMAEAVRVQMASFSGLPLHHLGARELRSEIKAEAEQREAARAAKGGGNELC